jgi:hypothetical protein
VEDIDGNFQRIRRRRFELRLAKPSEGVPKFNPKPGITCKILTQLRDNDKKTRLWFCKCGEKRNYGEEKFG